MTSTPEPRDRVLEVVIVNTRQRDWISKLIYSMQKAGLSLQEDYVLNTADRVLVFTEPPK